MRPARRAFTLEGLRYGGLIAVITVFATGTAFAAVEKKPDEIDGLWWAFTTMTTVGYGDVYPHTEPGRAIALS
jgi:hypothetical protein